MTIIATIIGLIFLRHNSDLIACVLSSGIAGFIVSAIFINKANSVIKPAEYSLSQKSQMAKLKKRNKKVLFIFIGVLISILVISGIVFFCVDAYKKKTETYNDAENLLLNHNYQEALDSFEKVKGYRDAKNKISFLKNVLSENYAEAIDIGNTLNGDYSQILKELEIQKKEKIYQQAQDCISIKDFVQAKTYLHEIKGYKDVNELYNQMDTYIKYYEALACEAESLVEALKIYRTLPKDFMDVSYKTSKYEAYLECLGTYGNPNGYVTDGIEIKDFIVEDGVVYLRSSNLPTLKLHSSDKSGYIGYLYWDEYDRKWYISKNKVVLYVKGEEKTFLPK